MMKTYATTDPVLTESKVEVARLIEALEHCFFDGLKRADFWGLIDHMGVADEQVIFDVI